MLLPLLQSSTILHKNSSNPCSVVGKSRSPTILAAYFITLGMGVDEALGVIKSKRQCIRPNDGFREQLREWEGECSGGGG